MQFTKLIEIMHYGSQQTHIGCARSIPDTPRFHSSYLLVASGHCVKQKPEKADEGEVGVVIAATGILGRAGGC